MRTEIISTLHSAHQGVYGMMIRAAQAVYWPGFSRDIENARASCEPCDKAAPSQPNLPPVPTEEIEYPFQHIVMDHCQMNGVSYGVFADRYTGWPGVYIGDSGEDVCNQLRKLCEDYGCPETLTTDNGTNYTSVKVKRMLDDYGIRHRRSSVGNPHANCRAEIAVKTVKRLLKTNVSITGKLDTAKVSRALLQYRNTKDRDTGFSPAMMLFGRELRDFLPRNKQSLMGEVWTEVMKHREKALATREMRDAKKWKEHSKEQKPLQVGDHVHVQNQLGNYPKRWDKRGVVVSTKGCDQYEVRIDGSRRMTCRNRKYLRPFHPAKPLGTVLVEIPTVYERGLQGSVEECHRDALAPPGPAHSPRRTQGVQGYGEERHRDALAPPGPIEMNHLQEPSDQPTDEDRTKGEQDTRELALPDPADDRENQKVNEEQSGRPVRDRRPPAWQRSGDYAMEFDE